MSEQQKNLINQPILDFGNDVPYAFGYLPENARLNAEIFKRALERANMKLRAQERGKTK